MRTGYRGNVRSWLKGYLFLGVAVMILAMTVYSNHLIARMREQSESTSRLFARYIGDVLFEVNDDGSLSGLRAVLAESNLPIIVTVLDGRPVLWHGVGVDERTDEDLNLLVTMDLDNPPTPKLGQLLKLCREFDRTNPPIPIRVIGADSENGYVHFGPSALQRELRFMPFVQLGIFLIFMGVAIQGLRYLKLSEQRSIWVGLAKETAHQLGTPLSAMMGWTQLIRDQAEKRQATDILGSIAEMDVDISRLVKVTDRFSKIGSRPDLDSVLLEPVIERTVRYFNKRLPKQRTGTTIRFQAQNVPPVRGNEELLEWVFENLIRNALDALRDDGGMIEIIATHSPGKPHVEIEVRDNGRGIPARMRERVFRPGFTTKPRGWGLGLALSQRIVQEYHTGSIRLLESRPGKGTTFLLKLPVA